MSWYDAIVYCNLRSLSEGLCPVYSLDNETDPRKWKGIVSKSIDDTIKYCGPSSNNSSKIGCKILQRIEKYNSDSIQHADRN